MQLNQEINQKDNDERKTLENEENPLSYFFTKTPLSNNSLKSTKRFHSSFTPSNSSPYQKVNMPHDSFLHTT